VFARVNWKDEGLSRSYRRDGTGHPAGCLVQPARWEIRRGSRAERL